MHAIKVAVVASVMAGLAGTANAAATFEQVTLGQAGPQGYNLCMFVTGATKIKAFGSGTFFNSNLGLAPGATTDLKGGGTLTGTLFKDPSASVQASIAANPAGNSDFHVLGGIITTSLAQAVADVKNAYSLARMLVPNVTFSNIKNATTITDASGTPNAAGGKNTVVKVTGQINLNGKTLTVQGNANDWFIINVMHNIEALNGGKIVLSGGIPASHVLFTIGGAQLHVNKSNSSVAGTFLAPNPGQHINFENGGVAVGGLISYAIDMHGNSKFTGQCYQAVPVPGTSLLIGLGGLVAARRRRA